MIAPNKSIQRFWRNKIASAGFVVVILLVVLSIFGDQIAPDKSLHANDQHISLKLKKPMTEINFLTIEPMNTQHSFQSVPVDSFFRTGDTLFYRKYKQPFWDYSLAKAHVSQNIFYLGTDGLGRDILSRLILGARISMLVGLIAVIISLVIGSFFGLIAGYYGGLIDRIVLWLINVFWAIPTILFAMVLLIGYSGKSSYQIVVVFFAVGLTMWVDTARLIRGLVMQLKERPFVEATKALGFSNARIILKHIFPNTFSTLIVVTASNFASAILIESGLSYLGLGVQPPTPSWGSMLREYYNFIGTEVSYLAIFPGLCIMISVLAFYLIGNGLRDALDVKEQ